MNLTPQNIAALSEQFNIVIECESPLEISQVDSEDNIYGTATGSLAKMLIQHMLSIAIPNKD